MHTEPRGGTIEKLVVHVNVGPEAEGGARSLAGYLQQIDGGYHAIFDDHETVTVAADDIVVWGASMMNSHGLHGCIIGYADQTPAQWADPYSSAAIDRAARWCATKCKQYGIPARRLSVDGARASGVKGICGHVDVTAAFGGNNAGHYDPGPNFPWDLFIRKVNAYLHPQPAQPKVPAQFDPPIRVAARLHNPQGGMWEARPWGRVEFIYPNGQVFVGGMIDNKRKDGTIDRRDTVAFTGRQVAHLELRWYRTGRLRRRKAGYTIVATSSERYVPRDQH